MVASAVIAVLVLGQIAVDDRARSLGNRNTETMLDIGDRGHEGLMPSIN
jgi:hypothetical protein